MIIPAKRKFTGKMDGFKDNQERHFYQRMLRAYLKGSEYFNFGFYWRFGVKYPMPHKVMQSFD